MIKDENYQIDPAKLPELREKAGLSAKDFGEKVNKSKACISNYENGWASPPSNVLLAYLILSKEKPEFLLLKSSK